MKEAIFTIGLILVAMMGLTAQQKDFSKLTGPYLGQKPPGMVPELFAPGIISTGGHEGCGFFSPDGNEFYFHKGFAGRVAIVYMKQKNGKWTSPQVASFSGKYGDAEPHLSYDGQKLVFSSNRPLDGRGEPLNTTKIWMVERNGSEWGEARPFGYGVDMKNRELHPAFSETNDLYFCSNRDDELDIFILKYVDGGYLKPEKLGNKINSPYGDGDAFVSPDGSYMVFISYGRPECFGNSDLYVSHKNGDGTWGQAINMGPRINTQFREVDPVISFDGKYLFFRSNRRIHGSYSDEPVTYDDILKIESGPGNGNGDIYWVSSKIIDQLKPDETK